MQLSFILMTSSQIIQISACWIDDQVWGSCFEATFCYVAFMHSENVEMVEEACLGLLRGFAADHVGFHSQTLSSYVNLIPEQTFDKQTNTRSSRALIWGLSASVEANLVTLQHLWYREWWFLSPCQLSHRAVICNDLGGPPEVHARGSQASCHHPPQLWACLAFEMFQNRPLWPAEFAAGPT